MNSASYNANETVPFAFQIPISIEAWVYLKTALQGGPNFQIWYGAGRGKSTLLQAVAEKYHYSYIQLVEPRELLRCRFKNHVLAVEEWDSEVKIPSAVILRLLELGNTIILVSNTLPIIVNPTATLLDRTHVIPFNRTPLYSSKNYDRLVEFYTRELEADFPSLPLTPSVCVEAKNQLRLLAEFTGWPAIPPTAPAAPVAPPTLVVEVPSTDKTVKAVKKVEEKPCPAPVNTVLPSVVPATVVPPSESWENIKKVAENEKKLEEANNYPTDDTAPEMEVPNYAEITLLLIHKDSSRPDDVLTIRVDPESDGWLVTLDQNFVGSSNTFYLEFNYLPDYLRRFFRCLDADDDGYSYVQFVVPLFPTVVIKRRRALLHINNHLLPQINFLVDDWPVDEVVRGPFKSL